MRAGTTGRRGATPGPVKPRPETKKPGDYADLITGGLISLATALAGFGLRKPAARIAQNANPIGKNLDRLAQEDKRVAKFLEWVTTPGVWAAALAPVIDVGVGCAADAGVMVGTPLEHVIKPMSDEDADEILAAHGIEVTAADLITRQRAGEPSHCPNLDLGAHSPGSFPDRCHACHRRNSREADRLADQVFGPPG